MQATWVSLEKSWMKPSSIDAFASSWLLTIQQYFPKALFIVLYKLVLAFESMKMKFRSVTIQMKATQSFQSANEVLLIVIIASELQDFPMVIYVSDFYR